MNILQTREKVHADELDIIESKESLASNLYRLGRFKTAKDYHLQNLDALKTKRHAGSLEKKRKIEKLVKQCDEKIEAKAAERRRIEDEKKERERNELEKQEQERKQLELKEQERKELEMKAELERKELERKELEKKELAKLEKEREAAEAAAEIRRKERHEAAKRKAEEKAKQKEKEAHNLKDLPPEVPEIRISDPPGFSKHSSLEDNKGGNSHRRSRSQDTGLAHNSGPSKSEPDLRSKPSSGGNSNSDGKSSNKPDATLNAEAASTADTRGRSSHQNNGSKITRSSSTAAAMPQRKLHILVSQAKTKCLIFLRPASSTLWRQAGKRRR